MRGFFKMLIFFCMKRFLCFFISVILLLITNTTSAVEIDFSGYLENRIYLQEFEDTPLTELNAATLIRARIHLEANPSENSYCKLTWNGDSYYGNFRKLYQKEYEYTLDRAYFELYYPQFDLTIGKQRVAWGVSYLWMPLDYFNQINMLEPEEELAGINAIRLYFPLPNIHILGIMTGVTAVISPKDSLNTSQYGIRLDHTISGTDLSLSGFYDGKLDKTIVGADIRSEWHVGFWSEVAYNQIDDSSFWKEVVGMDYTIDYKRGIYVLAEYYHDESGKSDPKNYNFMEIVRGHRVTLAKNYLYGICRYPFTDYQSISLSTIYNLDDDSYLLIPEYNWNMMQNLDLTMGSYVLSGNEDGEFNMQQLLVGERAYFLWLTMSF